MPLRNFIVRFPGTKSGEIVLATHYETNYPLRNINFVGANDGAVFRRSTDGPSPTVCANRPPNLPAHKLPGYSVWLLFDDGEESFQTEWADSDVSLRHAPRGGQMGQSTERFLRSKPSSSPT